MISESENQAMLASLKGVFSDSIAMRGRGDIKRVSIKWIGIAQFSNITGQRIDDRAVPDIEIEFEPWKR